MWREWRSAAIESVDRRPRDEARELTAEAEATAQLAPGTPGTTPGAPEAGSAPEARRLRGSESRAAGPKSKPEMQDAASESESSGIGCGCEWWAMCRGEWRLG